LKSEDSLQAITLHGLQWDNTAVLAALQDHRTKLPYLKDLFVAYCQGALQTWLRFTSEFSADGLIGSLTPEQRTKAFLPTTNDANEGALGIWRVWSRRFPSLTLHRFNAINMNKANQTKVYISDNFTPEQHKWVRAEARLIDTSQIEVNRKANIVAAQVATAAKNEASLSLRTERRQKREEHVAGITLILDPEAIQKLRGPELDDQLRVYKKFTTLWNGKRLPALSGLSVAAKKKLTTEMAQYYVQQTSQVEPGTLEASSD
jgi:hypothetical protein